MRGVGLAVTRDDEPLEERRRKQDVQLDRIEQRLDEVHRQVRHINGTVKRHEQILVGHDGHHGLVSDVRRQWDRIEKALQYAHQSEALSGMVSTRTLWGAVGAIAGVASVIVALVVGIT